MNNRFWQIFLNLNRNKRVRTPTILQMEAVECGAASLGIILAYYGRRVSLPELRIECGVSRNGSKASNLILAARRYGMEAKGFKVEYIEQLEQLDPPYLVFWDFNHYLVVEGITPHQIYLNDPAAGHRTVTRQEFDQKFTGVILMMTPTGDFEKGGQKNNVLRSIFSRLRYSKKSLAYSILAGLILVLPGLAIPIFSQIFVDYILVENFTHWLRPLLLGMFLTAFLQAGLSLLRLRYLRKLGIKLAIVMSSQFFWHILRLPISFYAQRYAGEISHRGDLNNKIAQTLSGQLATTLIDAILIIFYAILMFAYDWVLTLIGIGFSLINILTLYWVRKQRIDANLQLGQDFGKVSAVSISGLSTIETLKASALESDFFARWSGYYTKAINVQQTLEISNQILAILPILLTYLTTVFILIIGGFRVITGELTIGMLVAFQSLMQSFQRPITTLVDFGSLLQELEGDLVRLDDVLTHPTDSSLDKLTITQNSIIENQLTGAITLDNITFGYSPVEPPLIENFSLTLLAGQRVALVGSSGSGKSTIAKLICGLYQPWKGEIYFDGIPQSQIPRQVFAKSLSMVEQSIFFFGGTVRDNLTLWDDTIPHEQLIKACQHAEIHEVIMKLKGGYDGKLLEGGMNLSGGQRQRLEIARALVQNPSILVMDEPTSALDPQIEQLIVDNIRQRGCSCILVAHRLSTIRDCDEIIVLEKGKVVQRGKHQQLWEEGGIYADLIRYEG